MPSNSIRFRSSSDHRSVSGVASARESASVWNGRAGSAWPAIAMSAGDLRRELHRRRERRPGRSSAMMLECGLLRPVPSVGQRRERAHADGDRETLLLAHRTVARRELGLDGRQAGRVGVRVRPDLEPEVRHRGDQVRQRRVRRAADGAERVIVSVTPAGSASPSRKFTRTS
jgi:hypothetical protein